MSPVMGLADSQSHRRGPDGLGSGSSGGKVDTGKEGH